MVRAAGGRELSGRAGSAFRFAPARPSAVAAEAMVATSQPLATRAGLRMLERGGNAVDAAIAAAAVLSVTEPMSTGIGGDLFAIVSRDGEIVGLDAAGPAPAEVADPATVRESGPESVNVPGAVAGWARLSERHGRLGLDACLADAIDVAERGFAVGARTSRLWHEAAAVPEGWPRAPAPAERVLLLDLAATMRSIAEEGPSAFYRGSLARGIASASWLGEDDLATYEPRWVEPLALGFGGLRVLELPPPTQGVAALEGLGLVERLGSGLRGQIEAVRLALADAFAHVRDGADVRFLLSSEHLDRRASQASKPVAELAGGTVYLCAVDGDRTAVSLIQSLYMSFGSGVLVPGTGVVLNNRAACFSVGGAIEPGRRAYHTIIPGLLVDSGGALVGPFGVMGGFIQAQAHVQFVVAALEEELDPQAALDHARFRVQDGEVHLEPGLWEQAEVVASLGLEPVLSDEIAPFGGGQAIFVRGDSLVGGSDARKDGYAAGF